MRMQVTAVCGLLLTALMTYVWAAPATGSGLVTIGSLASSLLSANDNHRATSRTKRHELISEGSTISLKLEDGQKEHPQKEAKQPRISLDFGAKTEDLLHNIFDMLERLNYLGCFRRLVCDVATVSPAGEESATTGSLLTTIRNTARMPELSSVVRRVAQDLDQAIQFGEENRDNRQECEVKYDQCQFSGQRMQQVTQVMRQQMMGMGAVAGVQAVQAAAANLPGNN